MLDYILKLAPVILAIIFYFYRLENRLTKITTDISWIRENCDKCQPT